MMVLTLIPSKLEKAIRLLNQQIQPNSSQAMISHSVAGIKKLDYNLVKIMKLMTGIPQLPAKLNF